MSFLIDICAPTEHTEGTRLQILRWLKAIGDSVADNEPLLEIETDKVTIELPSPAAGILRETLKTAAQEVAAGELLGRVESGAKPSENPRAFEMTAENATVTGGTVSDPAGDNSARELLSPAVRRLLKEYGLRAESIRGSGLDGRLTAQDVLAQVRRHSAPVTDVGVASPTAKPTGRVESKHIPHSLMRKQIAARMVESLLHTAPHVTTVFEADLGAVLAHRNRHRDAFEQDGIPLTLTPYFIAATVTAIQAVPETNSRWTDEALEVFGNIDIGVATAIDGKGLVVPVIRDAESLDLRGLASQLTDLTTRARNNRLTAEDVRGGTFTISNHGVSGSLVATPIIINQPQSAILGIGKLEKRVVVLESGGADVIAIRQRCYVSLTVDHRVLDGHLANRFLQVFVNTLETWKH